MDSFFDFENILDVVIICVLVFPAIGFIIRIILWWKFVRGLRDVQRFYNAQVEAELKKIAVAIQMQQYAHVPSMAQATQECIAALPRPERRIYEHKLSDVVKGRRRLNKETGEWETA